MSKNKDPEKQQERGQSAWTVIKSVASAFIGVQNSKQHKEDFAKGKASSYIIAGLIGVLLFVAAVFIVVKIVLNTAAG